jgi:hypothetical protein
MSKSWFFRVYATGSSELIEELAVNVGEMRWSDEPDYNLFSETNICKKTASQLEITVGRNYSGIEAISEMVAQFPMLHFRGLGTTQVCEHLYSFEGSGGEIKWARQETRWWPGLFTYYGGYTRLDGEVDEPEVHITDPDLWVVLTAASLEPARIGEFAAAPETMRGLTDRLPCERLAEFIPAMDRIVELLAENPRPRLVPKFDDGLVEQ